jgi:large subunit ribosomal protein L22
MNTSTAQLNNFRQSPRKMRLVADMVRGKKVANVLVNLEFTTKRAANPLKKLIESALANAKAGGVETEDLVIKKITVDSGKILHRRRPAWRGIARPIRKRTSKITVELAPMTETKNKTKVKKKK